MLSLGYDNHKIVPLSYPHHTPGLTPYPLASPLTPLRLERGINMNAHE